MSLIYLVLIRFSVSFIILVSYVSQMFLFCDVEFWHQVVHNILIILLVSITSVVIIYFFIFDIGYSCSLFFVDQFRRRFVSFISIFQKVIFGLC